MKDRVVPEEEIEKGYINFCKDLGAEGEIKAEIDKYLNEHNMIIEQKEDVHLIWFEQIENEQVKYYSEPIKKYIPEPESEMQFFVKADGPISILHLPESAMPTYQFRQKRKGKIPQKEIEREERDSRRSTYQRHIDSSFEHSVFGYILFDGKAIFYPDEVFNTTILEYRGQDEKTIEYYNDSTLLKELLSNKDRYSWYELDDKYFIVRNSKKKVYEYLSDVKTQEIKIAKIEGNKVVLEDIIKDELTTNIEKEIDDCLAKTGNIYLKSYIRYSDNCFEIVKTHKIQVETEKKSFELFPKPDYRVECTYEKIPTEFKFKDIERVVVEGNKYKWFKSRGKLYITRTFGWINVRAVLRDYVADYLDAPECRFCYNNSPEDLVMGFIESSIWDGNKIIEKYECGQEVIDRMVSELIHRRHIERNNDETNRYKLIEDRADVSNLCFYIEYWLKL